MYHHQKSQWPHFTWDATALSELLGAVRHNQGRLLGRMEGLGFSLRAEAVVQTLTLDVLKTSEIEGEVLNVVQVRASLAQILGMDIGPLTHAEAMWMVLWKCFWMQRNITHSHFHKIVCLDGTLHCFQQDAAVCIK